MALVTLGFLALLLVTLFWVAWAMMWLVMALFWLAWPLTLLIVAAVAWRAQARYWRRMNEARTTSAATSAPNARSPVHPRSNRAFDEYRDETLRRLDEEREKFGDFLQSLRKKKDKEAFDRFIAERRARRTDGTQGATA